MWGVGGHAMVLLGGSNSSAYCVGHYPSKSTLKEPARLRSLKMSIICQSHPRDPRKAWGHWYCTLLPVNWVSVPGAHKDHAFQIVVSPACLVRNHRVREIGLSSLPGFCPRQIAAIRLSELDGRLWLSAVGGTGIL